MWLYLGKALRLNPQHLHLAIVKLDTSLFSTVVTAAKKRAISEAGLT